MATDLMYLDVSNSTSHISMSAIDNGPIMMTGEYAFVPNPCTSEPCLPGMIFALKVGKIYYYLTLDKQWIWEARSWNGFTPQVGQMVKATGEINEAINTAGRVYYNFEMKSLKPKR